MRINLTIDDKLIADAVAASGATSAQEVVVLGLRTLVGMKAQADIRSLRGNLVWLGDLDATRVD